MSDTYPSKQLADVCEFIRGVTYKPADVVPVGTADSVVCMRTKNVQKELDESDLLAVPEVVVKNDKKVLSKGDLLVSTANSFELVGKACWVPDLPYKATAGGFISIFRPDRSVLCPRYFYYWATWGKTRHALMWCGRQTTNISNLNFDIAKKLPVPLPPLAEQKRIAAILDKADAIRRKRQQAIQLTSQFLRSTFLDMFGDPVTNPKGWESRELSAVCKRIKVGLVIRPASYYVQFGVPALRSLNVRENRIDSTNFVYVSAEDNESKLAKSRVWKDDVVLVRSGQPGTAAVVPEEFDGINAIDILIVTPDKSHLSSHYLASFFNSPEGKRLALGEQRGQIQKHLNVGSLNKMRVPIPPLKEQLRFDALLRSHVGCEKTQKKARRAVDNLFNSLVQRAFRGEL